MTQEASASRVWTHPVWWARSVSARDSSLPQPLVDCRFKFSPHSDLSSTTGITRPPPANQRITPGGRGTV